MFVTVLALMAFAVSSLIIWSFVDANAWSSQSYYWHSDLLWGVDYLSPPSLEEQRINDARNKAQPLYEVLIAASHSTTALVTFVASLGMMFRKNWARLLIIAVLAIAMLEVSLSTLLFWRLRMFVGSDYVVSLVTISALVLIVSKLRSPLIVSEFRRARA